MSAAYKIRRTTDGQYLRAESGRLLRFTDDGGYAWGSLTALTNHLRRFGLPKDCEVVVLTVHPAGLNNIERNAIGRALTAHGSKKRGHDE